jgi:2-methylcitrate dehydratase PrpD
MATLVEQLAAYGARDAVRELPPEVMHHAKRAVIDWFSALYPGTQMDPARMLVAAHREELGVGRSSLPGFGTTAFPALAAWINGSASHSPEFDDIFRDGIYHPGCPVIAAALAVAEDRDRTGTEFLRAVVVGYEISTRIAASVQPSHYDFFHTTGTAGVFGAAAAAACLYAPGDEKVLKDALGTAGTFASGLQQAFRSDTMTKPLHAGHAAQVGVLAAQSAAAGVTGAADILEGEAGFGHALSKAPKFEKVVDGLGERYNITQMTQKNHGCCGHAFAAIDAVLAIMKKGVKKEDVERIEVDGYKATVEVAGILDPVGAAEAKFSTPYVLAHALKYGSVRLDAYEPHKLADAELRDLLRRVTLREDPALTAQFPGQRSARVAVTTKDGRRLEHFSPTRKGDPDDPLTDQQLEAKFLELAGPVIGEPAARGLLWQLWGLGVETVKALRLAQLGS